MLCSRITTLVGIFEKPASDEGEKKRREGLLRYAGGLRLVRPDSETFLVNSKTLKKDRGRCARSLCFCDLSIALRTAKMSADF